LAIAARGELTTRERLQRRVLSARRLREQAIEGFILLNALLGVVVLVGIMFLLLREGLPLFRDYSFVDFITGKHWFPVSSPPTFGILPSFTATLWVTGGAIALALPIGILSAVFLSEVAPPLLRDVLKPLIELISGVPSIVIGFIGLAVLVPFLADALNLNTGLTGLTAAIMLAFCRCL
jgi:phosphate transport system permease protein